LNDQEISKIVNKYGQYHNSETLIAWYYDWSAVEMTVRNYILFGIFMWTRLGQ